VRQAFGVRLAGRPHRPRSDRAYADNRLTGNGLQETRLLEQDYSSIYTQPDITKNRSLFLNLTGKHSLDDTTLLSGNVYYRKINTSTYNGDINEGALISRLPTQRAERAALTAAGYSGFPTSGANLRIRLSRTGAASPMPWPTKSPTRSAPG
jgi:hypothetical protein